MRRRWIATLTIALAAAALLFGSDAEARRKKKRRRARKPAATSAPAKPAAARAKKDIPRPGLAIEATEAMPARPFGRRVEFDALTVMGQTKTSGAVYLFERLTSEMDTLVERRRSYRDEIVRPLRERSRP